MSNVVNLAAWKASRDPAPLEWWVVDGREPVIVTDTSGGVVSWHSGPGSFGALGLQFFQKRSKRYEGPRPSWWKPSMAKRYGM